MLVRTHMCERANTAAACETGCERAGLDVIVAASAMRTGEARRAREGLGARVEGLGTSVEGWPQKIAGRGLAAWVETGRACEGLGASMAASAVPVGEALPVHGLAHWRDYPRAWRAGRVRMAGEAGSCGVAVVGLLLAQRLGRAGMLDERGLGEQGRPSATIRPAHVSGSRD